MPLCRKAQPAGGREIERPGIPGNFPHNESQVAAPQPFFQGKESIFRAICGDMDQPVLQGRRQARHIRPPRQADRRFILHPQPRTFIRRIGSRIGRRSAQVIKRKSKRQSRPARFAARGKKFCMPGRNGKTRPPASRMRRCGKAPLEIPPLEIPPLETGRKRDRRV